MEIVVKCTFTPDQCKILAKELDSAIAAKKNHIASAVESPEHWANLGGAEALVKKLREMEATRKDLPSCRRYLLVRP